MPRKMLNAEQSVSSPYSSNNVSFVGQEYIDITVSFPGKVYTLSAFPAMAATVWQEASPQNSFASALGDDVSSLPSLPWFHSD